MDYFYFKDKNRKISGIFAMTGFIDGIAHCDDIYYLYNLKDGSKNFYRIRNGKLFINGYELADASFFDLFKTKALFGTIEREEPNKIHNEIQTGNSMIELDNTDSAYIKEVEAQLVW